MKKRDRENLEFLLNASPEVIEDWYNQMDPDDIEYAFELLELYQQELDRQSDTITMLRLAKDKRGICLSPINYTVH